MANRFATQEQIEYVAEIADDIAEYQGVIPEVVKFIAGYIEVFSPDSGIEIRYITSEGRDEEMWRGALQAMSLDREKVNVWCLTVTMSEMLRTGQDEAMNSFDKPFGIGIDYYYDYDFGMDNLDADDNNNSEDFFNKKVDGFEFILEKIRTCLPLGAEIESGMFRRMIKQFTNASTHVAKGDFAIKVEGL